MSQVRLTVARVHVQYKLSALWASLTFLYIYGDYFGLYVPGKLDGMLDGDGPIGPVSQNSLMATSALLAIPAVMIFLSLVMPPYLNRLTNITFGLFFIAVMAVTMLGAWSFYIFLGIIEMILNAATVWYAWRWSRQLEAEANWTTW